MKNLANDMIPGDVFHPSETILEEMEAQNIRQIDLVKATGYNKSHISLLLKGKRGITIPIAIALEKLLGIDAKFWIRLQKNYELNKELLELKHMQAS
ncbi:HigA family addiction module antidote protein [Carboxylicivirga mesophila]|uniref:HigA family addiction module antidote protein n=1 Tax=Carboxylicivirga mesophila TaxID=1166478 RepID=A0ABS5K8W7_9BACT|nr:HigA family addiction module antitoxin [Carboxylicivirga mesophila]MBS2211430.1 HigA family addiction module antidote protein [Carboxylicivirga mesophila]